jgi:hypothetical protein
MVGFLCSMFESPFVTIFDGKILTFADEIPIFDEIPRFFGDLSSQGAPRNTARFGTRSQLNFERDP